MERRALWLVTLPIALAGIECGHALGNLIVGAPEGELFASPSSGRGALPLVGLVLVLLVVAGVAGRVAGSPRRSRAVATPFALLPPAGFVLLELGEALSEPGHFRLGGPAFALGLVFQIPAAALGYTVACALLRLGDEARAILLGLPRAPLALATVPSRLAPGDEFHATFRLTDPVRGRAPPVGA